VLQPVQPSLDDVLPEDPAHVVARLRAAGCVFAEEEAAALLAAATDPAHLAALVGRRVAGEPLELVLGWAGFCGLRVAVEPGVFVPRQRTALLVEQAVALLRGSSRAAVVVDLCCGSGAVGLAVATALGPVELHAADVDPVAVRCARRNLEPVGGRVHQGDLYAALPAGLRGRVDLLTVNAPYVPSAAVALMPPEARDHEPRTALDGGPDGTDLQRRVAAGARHWLAPGGTLLIETSARQAPLTAAAVEAGGVHAVVVRDDERDATVVVGTSPADSVSGSSPSAVTHPVTVRDGSVTR
jgi:release factor glutamine methyltransferase